MIKTVNYFVDKFNTTCPYELCEKLEITIVIRKLDNVNGITVKNFDNYLIFLNEDLTELETRFTLAHELGHIVLEHDLNFLFLSNYTFEVTNKYENAANSFATLLLLENYIEFSEFEVLTLDDISKITGIPINIVMQNESLVKLVLKSKLT